MANGIARDGGTVRILSIDGGGIRGIIPAMVLDHIEREAGISTAQAFHMIAGTSTGGIIACLLATPETPGVYRPAGELVDLYRERGPEIFQHHPGDIIPGSNFFLGPRYRTQNLENILREFLGERTLSGVKKDLLLTSYDIGQGEPRFFKSWKARGEDLAPGETAEENEFFLRDAVRSTTAAPTYFKPSDILNSNRRRFVLIDGGVFANNPAACALASARRLYPRAGRFVVVSLGTGMTKCAIDPDVAKNWGSVGWLTAILEIIFDGVADAVDYQMRQEFAPADYYRFDIQLSRGEEDENAPDDAMDNVDAANIRRLAERAGLLIEENRPRLRQLIEEVRRPLDGLAALKG